MPKFASLFFVLPLLITGGTTGALAENPGQFTIEHAWARPTIGAATSSAAYFTLTDTGAPDRLVGVSTPVAGSAEVHESISDNGVMKMRGVPGITLDPGKPVSFAPGGYHVMLMGVKQPLKPGDSFPMTLRFEHAPEATVNVIVQASGSGMSGSGMGASGMGASGTGASGMQTHGMQMQQNTATPSSGSSH